MQPAAREVERAGEVERAEPAPVAVRRETRSVAKHDARESARRLGGELRREFACEAHLGAFVGQGVLKHSSASVAAHPAGRRVHIASRAAGPVRRGRNGRQHYLDGLALVAIVLLGDFKGDRARHHHGVPHASAAISLDLGRRKAQARKAGRRGVEEELRPFA